MQQREKLKTPGRISQTRSRQRGENRVLGRARFSAAGASVSHKRIQRNIPAALSNKLHPRDCKVFPWDTIVKVPVCHSYRYPDRRLYAATPGLKLSDVLVNQQLIVEILSGSTKSFDRSYKFTYYDSIPSFVEYVLIAQD